VKLLAADQIGSVLGDYQIEKKPLTRILLGALFVALSPVK